MHVKIYLIKLYSLSQQFQKMMILSCNLCLRKLMVAGEADEESPDTPNKYLTTCYHIFCEECAKKSHPNCGECRKPTKYIRINKNMPLNARFLFEPLENVYKRTCTAIKFQEFQLDVNYKKMQTECEKRKEQGYKIKRKVAKMDEEHKKMEEDIQKMQIIMQKLKVSLLK